MFSSNKKEEKLSVQEAESLFIQAKVKMEEYNNVIKPHYLSNREDPSVIPAAIVAWQVALDSYQKAAEANHLEAQYQLAEFLLAPPSPLLSIHGNKPFSRHGNKSEFFRWMRVAAERGHAKAQVRLAFELQYDADYTTLEEKKKPVEEAIQWYSEAAKQDESEAFYGLGVAYLEGECGIEKNPHEGLRLIQLAADKGSRDPFLILGLITGMGQMRHRPP